MDMTEAMKPTTAKSNGLDRVTACARAARRQSTVNQCMRTDVVQISRVRSISPSQDDAHSS